MGEAFNRERAKSAVLDLICADAFGEIFPATSEDEELAGRIVDAILALPQPEAAFNREQSVDLVADLLDDFGPERAWQRQFRREKAARIVAAVVSRLVLPQPEDDEAIRYPDCTTFGPDCACNGSPVPQEDVTDEMAKRLHDGLRHLGWNDLHSWDHSGQEIRENVRAALVAALSREPGSNK